MISWSCYSEFSLAKLQSYPIILVSLLFNSFNKDILIFHFPKYILYEHMFQSLRSTYIDFLRDFLQKPPGFLSHRLIHGDSSMVSVLIGLLKNKIRHLFCWVFESSFQKVVSPHQVCIHANIQFHSIRCKYEQDRLS